MRFFRLAAILAGALALAGCNADKTAPKPAAPARETPATPTGKKTAQSNASCVQCHQNLQQEMISRVHERHGVGCMDCHGASSAHLESRRNKPDVVFARADVPAYCHRCHGEHEHPQKVKAFLEQYQEKEAPSGRVLLANPVCTDCHGQHNRIQHGRRERQRERTRQRVGPLSLFNGKDLAGWKPIGNAHWEVADGCIVGTQGEKNAPGDLLTENDYADFDLNCTYRVVWPANSGVWFRYQSAGQAYQADILEWPNPVAWSGTLYCTGKMFLAINTDKSIFDRDGWNTMRVRAEGDHVQVWLNGHLTADVHDQTSRTGKIGFQIHPGEQFGPMKMIVREIKLQPIPETRPG